MEKLLKNRACLAPGEIQAYLDNSLSEEQRFGIENHLLDCPLCEAALEGYAKMNNGEGQVHLDAIRQAIPTIVQLDQQQPLIEAKVRSFPAWRNWAAAAAAIALLICSAVIYQQWGPANSDSLYAQSYKPYDSPYSGERTADPTVTGPLALGLIAYQEGDYSKALPHFEEAITNSNDQFIAHFHAGLTNLELGNYTAAQELLSSARINTELLYGVASWYLALSFLKADDPERCRQVLMQIQPTEKVYYDQAQSLLQRLPQAKE